MAGVDKLSARFVLTAPPGQHSDGRGLYLQVDSPSAKRWLYIFQWGGKRKEMGLGSALDVGLKEARDERDKWRKVRRGGENPIEARLAEKKAAAALSAGQTFGEVTEEYLTAQEATWTAKQVTGWRNSLKLHAGPIWNKRPAEITTEDVLACLTPIWTLTPSTSKKVRLRIERILDAAKAKGLRSGENPARWKGHLSLQLSAPPALVHGHQAALPYDDLPDFLKELALRPGLSERALEFTILTVVRTNEALGADEPEFDLDAMVWTIPAERMKRIPGEKPKPHRVPFNADMLRVLGGSIIPGFQFPGRSGKKPLSNMAMSMALRRMKRTDITVHGFRSTFRDWAAEESDAPDWVVEMCLSHKVGSAVERAYRRSDILERRRKLMESWAAFCYPATR